jgi:hypothetical protein
MFVAYNLRRLINIIDMNLFKKFLAELVMLLCLKTAFLKVIKAAIQHRLLNLLFIGNCYKPATTALNTFTFNVYLNS